MRNYTKGIESEVATAEEACSPLEKEGASELTVTDREIGGSESWKKIVYRFGYFLETTGEW